MCCQNADNSINQFDQFADICKHHWSKTGVKVVMLCLSDSSRYDYITMQPKLFGFIRDIAHVATSISSRQLLISLNTSSSNTNSVFTDMDIFAS